MFDWLKSPKLLERAEAAAKQMRYFRLFSQKGAFDGLLPSATRAGFTVLYKDDFEPEAAFQWADGDPDFAFNVSFENPENASVVAESYRDIFGLVMVSYSHLPKIGIEIKPSLAKHECGRNAEQFRKIMLTFSDFDGGSEELLGRFKVWQVKHRDPKIPANVKLAARVFIMTQFVTKTDLNNLKSELTVRLGSLMVAGIAALAVLMRLH
jgi:hypothetical protein